MVFYDVIHADPEAPQPRSSGKDVSCRLMDRLSALGVEYHARVILLAQPQAPSSASDDAAVKDHLLACASRAGLTTVDLFPTIERLAASQREQLFHGHMTPEGNAVVAREIRAAIGMP